MIDLRSDTVTTPTEPMREAMARAPVGDDVYGDDPTVLALEARAAEILGKEAAVYMPTGSMTNQVALRAHTQSGDEIVADIGAHIYINEGGAPASLSGLNVRPLIGVHGIFTAEQLASSLRELHRFNPSTLAAPTKLVCLENTHNGGGGTIWPIETIESVSEVARQSGLALHLDGARLWHASAATGIPEADYAAFFDTVSVCFSKGLGAPVGSALAGSQAFIDRARRFKQMFGGGFRQAGIIAAGALYALENHRADLSKDHENAQRLAVGLSRIAGIDLDPTLVQTNIVRFNLERMPSFSFADRCHVKGVHMLPSGKAAMRAVVHRQITSNDVDLALSIASDVMAE